MAWRCCAAGRGPRLPPAKRHQVFPPRRLFSVPAGTASGRSRRSREEENEAHRQHTTRVREEFARQARAGFDGWVHSHTPSHNSGETNSEESNARSEGEEEFPLRVSRENAEQLWNFLGASLSPLATRNMPKSGLGDRGRRKLLDVATGTGQLARFLAKQGEFADFDVCGLDATSEMLDVARHQAAQGGVAESKIEWLTGDAAEMPFADDSFDLVTSRLAVHHFDEPQLILEEKARVAKPGAPIVVVDLVVVPEGSPRASAFLTPEDEQALTPPSPDLILRYNHLEQLRDPTHTVAHSCTGLLEILRQVGLEVEPSVPWFSLPVHLESWLALTNTPRENQVIIEHALIEELEGRGDPTGFRPLRVQNTRTQEDEIYLTHNYGVAVGWKPVV